jgi:HSP20 family molecular chaperone IbpA
MVSWRLVAFEVHLVSRWNAIAKIGQARRSHSRVHTGWVMSGTWFSALQTASRSGIWRSTPDCVPKYYREVTPVQTSHEEVTAATAVTGRTMRPQSVPVNVYEAPEALIVVAPFPAVTPDDVTIELREGMLRISARLRSSGPREYLLREWEYGGYERVIDLPEGYGSRVEASLTNGQLVVRVLRGPLADPLSMQPS